jgi:segregation and condensation protein A
MTEEENILQMVIEKESWEEIIYYIVSLEKINPWDVDLVKLTNGFLKFIRGVEELDFRIPAKIVFVAAVLLRLKAEYLSFFEEEEEIFEREQKPFVDLGIDPDLVELGHPIKRIPKRQVTLDELIHALRKALTVKEKRTERKRVWRAQVQAQISEEEDIIKRTERIMQEVEKLMRKLKKDKLEFRKLVKKWDREKIVEHLTPLLHLEQDKKVICDQEDYFKEIFISKQKLST